MLKENIDGIEMPNSIGCKLVNAVVSKLGKIDKEEIV